MEFIVLGLFCIALLTCVVTGVSVIYALLIGLILFCAYGKLNGLTAKQIIFLLFSGVKTAGNILTVLLMIGILTALWRAGGTIPVIICYASRLIRPGTVILVSFLLNCAVSFLTGTAFGTAATMGVVCAAMGASFGTNPVILGGAIISGSFFGDRCSPVSTSALLVSSLTDTSIFNNIKKMTVSAVIPFVLSCVFYTAAGLFSNPGGAVPDLKEVFSNELNLHLCAVIPAVLILLLSAFKVKVKITMAVSIAASVLVCLLIQNMSIVSIVKTAAFGFSARTDDASALLNGGGAVSMLRVMVIVGISASYSGIFRETDLLTSSKNKLTSLSRRISPFGSIVVTGVISAMISCNQTLAIMLTHQLCGDLEPDSSEFAIDLEDSAVVVAPLIPWSIAGAVPLASVGAPGISLLAACYLYLIPICTFIRKLPKRKTRPSAY